MSMHFNLPMTWAMGISGPKTEAFDIVRCKASRAFEFIHVFRSSIRLLLADNSYNVQCNLVARYSPIVARRQVKNVKHPVSFKPCIYTSINALIYACINRETHRHTQTETESERYS